MANGDSSNLADAEPPRVRPWGHRPGAVWALALSFFVAPAAWEARVRLRDSPRPRAVPELQRTIQVLDPEEVDHLVQLYFARREYFPQTYFNLLFHRWSSADEMLGRIFDKVVAAANSVDGGAHDYVIISDFFSYRSATVVQFAPHGQFHHDCDFWKVDGGDGLNLWILLDQSGNNQTFEVLERANNEAAYAHPRLLGNRQPLLMIPLSEMGFELNEVYRLAGKSNPVPFVSGHSSMLDARAILYMWLEEAMRQARALARTAALSWATSAEGLHSELGKRRFISKPNTSRFELRRGEALVLREGELHRTDLHAHMSMGEFRLAVGFKALRRQSKITSFLANCPAEKERMAYRWLWEELGDMVEDHYREGPSTAEHLQMLDLQARLLTVLSSNAAIIVLVAGCGLLISPVVSGEASFRTSLLGVVLATSLVLALVVFSEYEWILKVNREAPSKGGRRTSAFQAAWR